MRNMVVGHAAIDFLLVASGVSAAEYEFYKGCQYPGKDLRPGVGLNNVVDPGGEPQEYARRTVRWWPREGHDIVHARASLAKEGGSSSLATPPSADGFEGGRNDGNQSPCSKTAGTRTRRPSRCWHEWGSPNRNVG